MSSNQLIKDAKNLNVGVYDQKEGRVVARDSQGKELAGPSSWLTSILLMNPIQMYMFIIKIAISIGLIILTYYYLKKYKIDLKPPEFGFIGMFILFLIVFYTFFFYSLPRLFGM
jgi:hypothetical protein